MHIGALTYMKIFSAIVEFLQHHDAILDFWDRLIRQEVIKIDSSNVVCE